MPSKPFRGCFEVDNSKGHRNVFVVLCDMLWHREIFLTRGEKEIAVGSVSAGLLKNAAAVVDDFGREAVTGRTHAAAAGAFW